jgi:hypothetical protein
MMEIVIDILEILPVFFTVGAVLAARASDDTLEKIKYILWAILFQTIPIVTYVMQ